MKGFTLIELLVVCAIIGFLTVSGYERLDGARERARRAAAAAERESWRTAAALYQFRNDGALPSRSAFGARAGGGR